MRIIKVSERDLESCGPCIGVELDGVLARQDNSDDPEHIGAPIPKMLARVKRWIAAGKRVKIFTERAKGKNRTKVVKAVKAWCREHLSKELEVISSKGMELDEFWDARADRIKDKDEDELKRPWASFGKTL